MKHIYSIIAAFLMVSATNAQTVEIAGSAAATGSIHSFYYDEVDNLLYGIGSVSNVSGQTVDKIVAWNGTEWVAKGDQTLLTGDGLLSQTVWNICRNKDTLYAMADKATHSLNFPVGLLMYWDTSVNNWKSKTHGVFGNSYYLVSHSDTLFMVGNPSGALDLNEGNQSSYVSLGSMAYWNGSRWVKYASAPSFNYNPNGAVSLNGTLYLDNYSYSNGIWTNLNVSASGEVKAIAAWGNNIIYGVEDGATNEVKMFDGSTVSTLGSFDHSIRSIAQYDGKFAVCGNFDDVSGASIEEIAIWDGSAWSGVDTSFNGTVTTLGGYHNQLLISSQEGYPFYDTKLLAAIGSIGILGGAIQVDVRTIEGNRVGAYPNPTTGILFFSENVALVELFDGTGSLVLSESNVNQIELAKLSTGLYFVRLSTDVGVETTTVVKK